MLRAGHSNNVSFKVHVMGTQVEPRVRVVIAGNPELSFPAEKRADGWFAPLAIPAEVAPGSYDLRVEVLLNNRLFTPINKRIEIAGVEKVAEPDYSAPDAAPVVAVRDTSFVTQSQATPAASAPKEVVMPQVVAKMPEVKPKFEAKAPSIPATLSALEERAKKKPKKVYERIVTPLPKPSSKPAEPTRVSLAEIDKAVPRTVTTAAPIKEVQASKPKSLVRLIKENLFYE